MKGFMKRLQVICQSLHIDKFHKNKFIPIYIGFRR